MFSSAPKAKAPAPPAPTIAYGKRVVPTTKTFDVVTDFLLVMDVDESGALVPTWELADGCFFTVRSSSDAFCVFVDGDEEIKNAARDLLTDAFSVTWPFDNPNYQFFIGPEKVPFRTNFIRLSNTVDGANTGILCARRGTSEIPDFSTYNLPAFWREFLLDESLSKGGLVILAGSTGSGKTTLLYSALLKRLHVHGGRVVTVEQPVELIVPIKVGRGIWISSEPRLEFMIDGNMEGSRVRKRISVPDAWAAALREAMRQFPASADNKVLFLGEMREAIVAYEAVQAADSGHLVVLTMHGTNLISALRRFVGFVAQEVGNEATAAILVGSVLRGIFWQKMRFESGQAKVEGRSLFFQYAGDDGSPGREALLLSKGDFRGLNDPILTQANDIKIACEGISSYETASPEQRQAGWKTLKTKFLEKDVGK